MNSTERITVRLPSDMAEQIQKLVDSGEYSSVSDVIRESLESFLSIRFPAGSVNKVVVELPRSKVMELETLVQDGESISLDDAIRDAVREYTRARLKVV
ncbi:MAG: ribbon-helix-helix protein, CopG family [Methanomassiliicoccaceae archaeon]|nr:ribbon-helix-helix protein, CopG family [Methanomassiliicoccaceae archaeon]